MGQRPGQRVAATAGLAHSRRYSFAVTVPSTCTGRKPALAETLEPPVGAPNAHRRFGAAACGKRLREVIVSALEAPNLVESNRARLLTVDDHSTFLALLRDVVRATDQLQVVGEAETGERAIELA